VENHYGRGSITYAWQDDSTYIRLSPFFDDEAQPAPKDIRARVLAMQVRL
jgi:aconitate hydratase